jgi:hypothetical protein
VPQDDDFALFDREREQRRLHMLLQLGRLQRRQWTPHGVELAAEGISRMSRPDRVEAFVPEYPVNPTEETALGIVGLELLERLDEGVLGRIAGIFPVAQHPERDVEEHPLVPLDQDTKGRRVPGSTPTDDRRVVRVL